MSRTQYIITNSITYHITRDWRSAGLPADIQIHVVRTLCHELNISSRTLSSIIPHEIGVPLDYVYIDSVYIYIYVYLYIYRYILYVCVYIYTHIDRYIGSRNCFKSDLHIHI